MDVLLHYFQGDGAGQCGLDEKDGTLAISGDGGFVRLWSSETRQLRTAFSLTGFPSRACAFAPGESTHLAIGIGSVPQHFDVDGKFYVLDIVPDDIGGVSLSKITEGHNAKAWISCAAYSPDGQTLALGAADNVIYLHGQRQHALRVVCGLRQARSAHEMSGLLVRFIDDPGCRYEQRPQGVQIGIRRRSAFE